MLHFWVSETYIIFGQHMVLYALGGVAAGFPKPVQNV